MRTCHLGRFLTALFICTGLLTACENGSQPGSTPSNTPATRVTDAAAARNQGFSEGGMIGKQAPAFSLLDMESQQRQLDEWQGKVIVINFWATWCPPCVREMPMFVELQDTYGEQGLQFIGVAIDNQDKVQDFMDTMGVNYPMLIGAADAIEVSKQYGNRFGALPYSVIIDRKGQIRYIQRGELLHEVAVKHIKALL